MRLHVGANSYLLHQTISSLENRLDPQQFVRLHRSHIVRRDHIARLRHDGSGVWSACLADDTEIRIGRTYLANARALAGRRSDEHTSELQSLMRISYDVFCLKRNTTQ